MGRSTQARDRHRFDRRGFDLTVSGPWELHAFRKVTPPCLHEQPTHRVGLRQGGVILVSATRNGGLITKTALDLLPVVSTDLLQPCSFPLGINSA